MQDLKKHAGLLTFLLLLLFIKFIVVPIFAWQDQAIININSQEKKLQKITTVLEKESLLNKENDKLSRELAKVENIFFPSQVESAFKLTQQQFFEQLLQKNNLVVNNFAWQTTATLEPLSLKRYQAEIRLEGKLKNVINLFIALETSKKRIEIEEFNFSPKGQNDNTLGYIKSARIKLNLYMKYNEI